MIRHIYFLGFVLFLFSCKTDKPAPVVQEEAAEAWVEPWKEAKEHNNNSKDKGETILVSKEKGVAELEKVVATKDVEKPREVTVKKNKCEKALSKIESIIQQLVQNPDDDALWDRLDQFENSKDHNECKKSHEDYLKQYDVLMEKLN